MNERIKELALQALKHPDNDNDGLTVFDNDELKKFAELMLTDAFTIIKEAMVDPESYSQVDEVIDDRLDEAAYDVCDKLGLFGPIYEG